ncbi:hypothetical protein QSV37_02995 [Acinetobacter sp. VNK23]|uniref:hypothetical protein n=1 Tax=Acinetobacter thutiue TaxID=2998078 RepID=UPI0025790F1C|nr:hypothetical protein [Acinetobacter thutiue]MDM1019282.1 hypothetical protein [Acinetobacter thutiue]
MKFISLLIIVLTLVGCVSIQPSNLADLSLSSNYNANGKNIYLDYIVYEQTYIDYNSGKFVLEDVRKKGDVGGGYYVKMFNNRKYEIENLLKSYNYNLVENKKDADRILTIEERLYQDFDGSVVKAVSTATSMLTLGIMPNIQDEKNQYFYKVFDKNNKLISRVDHNLEFTNIGSWIFQNKDKLKNARLQTHKEALAILVEQGAI